MDTPQYKELIKNKLLDAIILEADQRKFTQSSFARACGMTQTHAHRLFKRELSAFSIEYLIKIMGKLGFTCNAVFTNNKDKIVNIRLIQEDYL